MAHTRQAPGPAVASMTSLVEWMRDPGGFFTELARDYGDVVRFMGKPSEAFFINHPTYIEQILVDHNWNFVPVRTSAFNLALRRAVPTSSGLLHQHQRQKVKPLLEPDHIDRLAQMITSRATRMQARWNDGDTIDILDEMMCLTVAIFVESLTGPVEQASDEELENAIAATWYQATRSTHPASVALDFVRARAYNRRYWRAMRGLDAAIYERIDRARKRPGGEGMLSSLLQVMDGTGMTDRQLRDEMVAFYVANTNTGAELAWIWYLLSQHPEVEAQLHDELAETLSGATPTLSDLAGLSYLQQVMSET
ncbi:MAG: cytochrome P450, partial [Vicinamibacterales bacterium]